MANWTTPEFVKNRCAVYSYQFDKSLITVATIQDAQRGTLLPFLGKTLYDAIDADANTVYSWDADSSYDTSDLVAHQYVNKGTFDVGIYQNVSGGNTGKPDATSGDWTLSGSVFNNSLYDNLMDNGLHSALDWAVWLNVLPRLTYQTGNAGVMSNSPANAENTSRAGMEALTRDARASMERALERLTTYMEDNVSNYSTWAQKQASKTGMGIVRNYKYSDRLPRYE